MSATQVFFEPPLRRSDSGPFQYATFGVQIPDQTIASTQVKISDAAWEGFVRAAREQSPQLELARVGQLLGEYLAAKILDCLDSRQPLHELYDFVASGGRAFRLDPLDVQMFIRDQLAANE